MWLHHAASLRVHGVIQCHSLSAFVFMLFHVLSCFINLYHNIIHIISYVMTVA